MNKATRTINLRHLEALEISGGYVFSGSSKKARNFLNTKSVRRMGKRFSVEQVGPGSIITRVG